MALFVSVSKDRDHHIICTSVSALSNLEAAKGCRMERDYLRYSEALHICLCAR